MQKHPGLTETRIARTLERIAKLLHPRTAPLRLEAFEIAGEPMRAEEAFGQSYAPFQVGDAWGRPWGTTWFRVSGEIPTEWKGEEVVALIELGGEGGEGFTNEALVWENGVPTRAINVNRADVPLAKAAAGGETFSFYLEAGANSNAQNHGYNIPNGGGDEARLFRLKRAELAVLDREAFELFHDFRVAFETLTALPGEPRPGCGSGGDAQGRATAAGPRAGQMLFALNEACAIFHESNRAGWKRMREIIAGILGKKNGGTAHEISAVGHAHIDTAWLWPLRETIRKCARTFSTQLRYMEEYPGYVFACSQPQQYAWMKEYYPAIFDGIKAAVKRGQWELVGSMWIEADCNLSSGEALVRQILHGKNFFLDEFGVETRDVWIPDVFGYSASMPQIMRKSGVEWFMTQKISWSQFNQFPHHTFWWEGIDGTRIFSHFPPADTYNGDFSARQLQYSAANFKEHDRATRSLYLYGHGDGGGGPTRGMLESAARLGNVEGLPKVALETVREFFPKALADARDLPVWAGELYLELHRGTYTTQARNKKGNRKCELLLRDAEFFDVASGGGFAVERGIGEENRQVWDVFGKNAADAAGCLDRAWKLLLLNQFHDIIPGSSIGRVYEESSRDYAQIAKLARAVLEPARAGLLGRIDTGGAASPVVVWNTASFTRSEVVSLPDGEPIHVEVPPCGYAVVDAAAQRPVASFAAPVEVFERRRILALDNGMLRLIFNRAGDLCSIKDHRAGRDVLAPDECGNVFQIFDDHPNAWDAWDVDIFALEKAEIVCGVESIEVTENTPLRATVRTVRRFGNGSSITQRISLCAGSARIDFDTEVDWREDHKLLKVAFPVQVRSPRATYEIQYGHCERPTHGNTSWDWARFEVCAQRWADLSEGDYGVALLNDCKYGYDIAGNVMRLSLLRAPTAPDETADRGHHQFTYSLLPHAGDFRAGRVIQSACALNIPLQVMPVVSQKGALPETQSFFAVDRPGVIIEAVKRAERENAVIVRLYEAYGTRGAVTLSTSLPFARAFSADLLERTLEPVEMRGGKVALTVSPFEIVTLKFLPE